MANKTWAYGQVNGLDRQLKLVGFAFLESDQPKAKITVFLREQILAPNGEVVSEKSADYSIIKNAISYDINGNPLPKKDLHGNIAYKSDGVTPEERDNAYENIVYYVDNKIMSVYELIDEGVRERFNIIVE